MSSDIKDFIEKEIKDHRVVLFMKGSKLFPQCGFSGRVVSILNMYNTDYVTHDVLESPELRQGIKEFSQWPTIPQLYIDGEFVGGCDIVSELAESGELTKILGVQPA